MAIKLAFGFIIYFVLLYSFKNGERRIPYSLCLFYKYTCTSPKEKMMVEKANVLHQPAARRLNIKGYSVSNNTIITSQNDD